MNKPIFTIAIACACAHFAVAEEQVSDWFSGTTGQHENGAWIVPDEGVTIESGKYNLDDPDENLVFAVTDGTAPDSNVVTRIYSEVTFMTNALALPELPDGTKTAFCVTGGVYVAKIGSDWVSLTGGPKPTEDEVKVLVELDCKSSPLKVRFGIVGAESTSYLYAAGGESGKWSTLTGVTSPTDGLITNVSYAGTGYVKSLSSKVQLGLFENNGVKYGTADEAVVAAQASGGSSTITVIRDNNEDITIPEGSTIAFDQNGKACGEVTNESDTPVQVNVSSDDVAQGNGAYEITAVDGKYTVYTSDTSKDAYAVTNDNKVYAVITTKDSIISGLTVAGKELYIGTIGDSKLRTYLQANSSAYSGANSTTEGIQNQLNATGDNGMTLGQSYALGLDPKEAIVLQPATADTSTTAVTLAMPNVDVNDDFTVTYQVQKHNGTTWVNDGDATATPQIPVGSGRFRVNTVIAPKN